MNAIDAFENREITMRGQYKGQEINDAIEIERQKLINEAKKEPICMLVDSPDPHGNLICLHFSLSLQALMQSSSLSHSNNGLECFGVSVPYIS